MGDNHSLAAVFMLFWQFLSGIVRTHVLSASQKLRLRNAWRDCPLRSVPIDARVSQRTFASTERSILLLVSVSIGTGRNSLLCHDRAGFSRTRSCRVIPARIPFHLGLGFFLDSALRAAETCTLRKSTANVPLPLFALRAEPGRVPAHRHPEATVSTRLATSIGRGPFDRPAARSVRSFLLTWASDRGWRLGSSGVSTSSPSELRLAPQSVL